MNIKLKIWRQKNKDSKGHFEEYAMSGIEEHMSFLEVLDLLNEQLFAEGKEPVAFDSDCREGICGQCGVVINGQAHGPIRSTTCQLHMRHLAEDPSFKDGSTITIEPWRSTGFPVLRDLIVDRSALDRIVQAGGYISVNTGGAPEAHSVPVQKEKAGRLLDFFELAELMCIDALHRRESCGGHFRAESQTPEGEALRHDDEFLYVAAWEWGGENQPPILHKEDLVYKDIELKQRSYK